MIGLFQDSTSVLPHYISVHPYGMAVYSVLVSLLVTAIVLLWRKLAGLEKMFVDMVKEGSTTLANVGQRLEDQQVMKETQNKMTNTLGNHSEKLDKILQKLEDKK